jgi:hypothetical protein
MDEMLYGFVRDHLLHKARFMYPVETVIKTAVEMI